MRKNSIYSLILAICALYGRRQFDSVCAFNACIADILLSNFKTQTIMTKQELANEKRLNKAVIASSMTLAAQLKSLNHDAGFKLTTTASDGTVTEHHVTKREQIAKLGMQPLYRGKSCMGYTPATFNAAVDDSLKMVGLDGHVKDTYVYVDRVVTVTMEDPNTGQKDYSLYTSEEADKKVKGESAQSCKLYRKVRIGANGWGPGLIVKVLWQSRHIADEIARAEKSKQTFEEQRANGLYVVINKDGKLVKVKVNVNFNE